MKLPENLRFLRRRQLPVMHAAEAAECGLACMAMIGNYHGHDMDLNGLRQRFPVSLSGASLRSLMTLADQMSFSTRALKVELGTLAKVRLPAILHWDLNHFVVLNQIRGKTAIIHDPGRGRVEYALDDLSKHYTGVVLEVFPTEAFRPVTAKSPIHLGSLWSRLHGIREAALLILALSVALQIATFAVPFQMQLVVDEAIGHNDADLLTVIALGFGGLILLQAILTALRDWTLQLMGSQMVFQMVGNLLRHLIRLPASFFEKRHVGDILSRLGSTRAIQDALTHGIASALIDGVMAILAGTILFIYAPYLALVVVVSLLIVLCLAFSFYPVMRARTQEMISTSASEQSHLMETVRAATTIKLMGRESERESAWRNLYSKTFNATVSLGRFQISLTFLQATVIGLQTVLVIYLGAQSILSGHGFSIGMLMAFLSFRQTFTDRAQSLVAKAFEFRMLNLHLERLGDIVAQEPESKAGDTAPFDMTGAITVRDMSFRYGASDPWIFQNLDMDIEAGDFVAITGASGGGKTTLLKLLLGLQAPNQGQIRLDGQTATPDLWRSWRSQVGVVSQDDRLLSGTLADNIAFFDPDMNMDLVYGAAQAAQVHADIMAMPMKYLTLVGDMGSTLSGGQRQRILLARALYRRPRMLILDEGTANLDPHTEEAIADLVAGLGITRVVVAHRPALIQRARRVLNVERGGIKQTYPFSASNDEAYEQTLVAE